ncbi:MAG TPA: hypothetical protein VNR61_01230 [Niallia sp.]|nr:hypothetical protein [Niallia sp.]
MSTRMCSEPEPEPRAKKEEVMNKPFLQSLNTDKDSAFPGRDV